MTATETPEERTSYGERGRHLIALAAPVIHEAVSRGRTDRHCCDGTGSVCRRAAGELLAHGLLGDAEALSGAQSATAQLVQHMRGADEIATGLAVVLDSEEAVDARVRAGYRAAVSAANRHFEAAEAAEAEVERLRSLLAEYAGSGKSAEAPS